MKMVTIGGATQDIFLEYPAETAYITTQSGQSKCVLTLEEGKKIEVHAIAYEIGGGAVNAALSFKYQGFQVHPVFKVGTDDQGNFILQALTKKTIDISHAIQAQEVATALSIIIPCPSGDRTILCYRGANRTFGQEDIPLDLIKTAEYIYISSLSGSGSALLPIIAEYARTFGITVAVNPSGAQLKNGIELITKALPSLDIFVLNATEACLLMESLVAHDEHLRQQVAALDKQEIVVELPKLLQTPLQHQHIYFKLEQFFKKIHGLGPKIVIVTNGAEGVYVYNGESILFHPALAVPVVSSVGAGDAFGSTFVGSLARGKSLEDALRLGVINAASVIGHVGATTGLLQREELEKRLEQLDKKLLRKFTL